LVPTPAPPLSTTGTSDYNFLAPTFVLAAEGEQFILLIGAVFEVYIHLINYRNSKQINRKICYDWGSLWPISKRK